MEVPKYLRVLWDSKWLLLVGLLVAAVAAFFAGFAVEDGEVVPRAESSYTAGTTVLVSSQTQPLYQAVIPGTPLVENQTTPTDVDLTSKAILYAYLVSGQDIRNAVEAEVGAFAETDALTALRRTTQPGGDEAFAGRYELPILDIVGFSTDPERAELISRTATAIFLERVLAEQTASALPEPDRVILTPLDQKPAEPGEGSNPAIPIVVAFLGVFLLFVAVAFILAGARAAALASVPRRNPSPQLRCPPSPTMMRPSLGRAACNRKGHAHAGRARRASIREGTLPKTRMLLHRPTSPRPERHS